MRDVAAQLLVHLGMHLRALQVSANAEAKRFENSHNSSG
jgi:hypothetical protein